MSEYLKIHIFFLFFLTPKLEVPGEILQTQIFFFEKGLFSINIEPFLFKNTIKGLFKKHPAADRQPDVS
jgi:hypothetical protein